MDYDGVTMNVPTAIRGTRHLILGTLTPAGSAPGARLGASTG